LIYIKDAGLKGRQNTLQARIYIGVGMGPYRDFYAACTIAFGLFVLAAWMILAQGLSPNCAAPGGPIDMRAAPCGTTSVSPAQDRLSDRIWKLLVG
jgi:hypothetical protein